MEPRACLSSSVRLIIIMSKGWRENDRLRAEASAILVDAALAARVAVYVQPTVTFVYPGDCVRLNAAAFEIE
jgi:hypothetical protein